MVIVAVVVLVLLTAWPVLANPFHHKLLAASEKERNARLAYVVQDHGCQVIRSFFQGTDTHGNASWNVACSNGKALVVTIRNDAQGSTRILECGFVKAMNGPKCFKKF